MMNKQTAKKTGLGKSVLAGAVATAFLTAGAHVFAEDIENLKISNGYVTIEGELIRETKGASVTLLVADSDIDFTDEKQWLTALGDEVSYYKEFILGDDKAYSFKFMLSQPGVYNVYIASKTEGVEKSMLTYIDEDKSNGVVSDALLVETSSDLKTSMENKLSDLGVFEFTKEDFDNEAASLLYLEIEDKDSIKNDKMIILTEKAILASKINNGTLNSFYDYPKLSFLNDKIFTHLTEDIVEETIANMGTGISDIKEFDDLLIESTVLTLSNQNDGATLLKNALSDYKTELGITRDITDDLCQAIIEAPDFSDFASVKTAIENYEEEDEDGGGSNGGSSGGGSSSGKVNVGNLGGIIPTTGNTTTVPSEISPFDDIENVSWAKEAITRLYKDKVLNGKAENLFCPLDNVTRAEFAKMLMLAFDVKLVDEECPFTDVNQDEWSYPYIRSAYLSGVVKGIDDVTFGKELNITRQDLCVMVYRLLTTGKPELLNQDDACEFKDLQKISDYAVTAVGFMQKNGIVNGDETGSFNPMSPATRAEAAKIIYNSMILYGKE